MVDTVLSGGWIIDGTRTPPYQADLCIQDGKIVAISPQWEGNCRTRVDVTGKIVSPGFIDIHTHSDTCPFSAVFPESKVAQGITLEIVGNCEGPPRCSAEPRGPGTIPRSDLPPRQFLPHVRAEGAGACGPKA